MADGGNKIMETLDTGLDLGVLATLLMSLFGFGKGKIGHTVSSFLNDFGKNPEVKQRFGKWFGIGLEDEAEILGLVLGQLARTEGGVKKVIAINFLLAAMKDDAERNMFRAIIIKINAGRTEATEEVVGADGKPSTKSKIINNLGTADDLRVKTLDSLATVMLGGDPEHAFESKKEVNGKQIVVPTVEEEARIALALSVVRNQGLGKESELVTKARSLWRSVIENHFDRLLTEVSCFLAERKASFMGYPEKDKPSILVWLPEQIMPGSYKTPFSHVWEVGLIVGAYRKLSNLMCGKRKSTLAERK